MKSFVTNLCSKICKGRPSTRKAPERRCRPAVEMLEDRLVPTILFHPVNGPETATDNNGTHMNSVPVYLIFNATDQTWGDVNSQALSGAGNAVVGAVQNLLGSAYLQGLTHSNYGTDGVSFVAGVRIDNTPLADGAFTTSDIDDLIDNQVDNYLPDDSSAIYLVITAPGVLSGEAGAGGYNFHTDLVEGWVGSPANIMPGSQAFTDGVTQVLSHELVEAITDGWQDGVTVTPGGPHSNQIGDNEAQNYVYRVNGTLAQSFWSQGDGAYLVEDGTSQVFDLTGGVLTINGDQIFLPTDDTITIDTSAAGGVMVTLNNETATFEPNQVNKIVVNPGGSWNGYNNITVKATNVPISINDTDPRGDSVTIGKQGNVQGVHAPVTIHNSSSYTDLVVDNQFDTTRKIDITKTKVDVSGAAAVSFVGTPLHQLTVWAGCNREELPGSNQITISGIAGHPGKGPTDGPSTTLVTINAGPGLDDITVGKDLDKLGWLTINGQQGNTTLFIDDSANHAAHSYSVGFSTLTRSGMPGYIVYSQLRLLDVFGSTGANQFTVNNQPPCTTNLIAGKSGHNTLTGPDNMTNDWTIDNPYTGSLSSNAGPVVTFQRVQNLRGGNGVDNFHFSIDGKVASIDGKGGGDWLDYSAFDTTHGVTVNLAAGTATQVTGSVSHIQNVIGGAGADKLTGCAGGNILLGGGGIDVLVGGAGGNLLIGGADADTLTAGKFGDILIGATTDYDVTANDAKADAHRAALAAILKEWRLDSPALRILHLTGMVPGGLNGNVELMAGTVHDDAASDTLKLSAGIDWYFRHSTGANQDVIKNVGPGDQAYDI
jgi:hypothetical protein